MSRAHLRRPTQEIIRGLFSCQYVNHTVSPQITLFLLWPTRVTMAPIGWNCKGDSLQGVGWGRGYLVILLSCFGLLYSRRSLNFRGCISGGGGGGGLVAAVEWMSQENGLSMDKSTEPLTRIIQFTILSLHRDFSFLASCTWISNVLF